MPEIFWELHHHCEEIRLLFGRSVSIAKKLQAQCPMKRRETEDGVNHDVSLFSQFRRFDQRATGGSGERLDKSQICAFCFDFSEATTLIRSRKAGFEAGFEDRQQRWRKEMTTVVMPRSDERRWVKFTHKIDTSSPTNSTLRGKHEGED
ncbi:unnamed protein product [Linum tenue]|uniref:Uncharacterized protein n=1 Tax=Linum tenue TaxID=586396 RepID=A0AAV0KKI6_9ROSI|nr:unnamed protein product [Linum tenue]